VNAVQAFRRAILRELKATHGDTLPVAVQCLVVTACRFEIAVKVGSAVLRASYEKLTPAEKVSIAESVYRNSEGRDRILTKLGLNRTANNPTPSGNDWDAIDAMNVQLGRTCGRSEARASGDGAPWARIVQRRSAVNRLNANRSLNLFFCVLIFFVC